jgi:hypothetical protein
MWRPASGSTPPTTADLGSDTAYVHPVSEPAGGAGAATLRVYHGGVDPTLGGGGPSKVPTDPIGGRAAYFIRPPQSTSVELLRQYSATGFAVLTAGRSALMDEQMRQLAAAFSPGWSGRLRSASPPPGSRPAIG